MNSTATTTLAILVSVLLYALSVGPVEVMLERGWISKGHMPFLVTFYQPLIWTVEHTGTRHHAAAYVRWCKGEPPMTQAWRIHLAEAMTPPPPARHPASRDPMSPLVIEGTGGRRITKPTAKAQIRSPKGRSIPAWGQARNERCPKVHPKQTAAPSLK